MDEKSEIQPSIQTMEYDNQAKSMFSVDHSKDISEI